MLAKEIQESQDVPTKPVEVTRKASLATNTLPAIFNNSTSQIEQQKPQPYEPPKQTSNLTVLHQDRELHSLPETSAALQRVEIPRPFSDTNITTMSVQVEDDVASPMRYSHSLHIKDGEKMIVEQPKFEGLSFSVGVDVDDEEKLIPEEHATAEVSFYISDLETPTTPVGKGDILSPFLALEGPTEATLPSMMPSRKLLGSSSDFSYHLKDGQWTLTWT